MRGTTVAMMALSSFAGTIGVVTHAFHLKKQFYPSVVYISSSGVCMMVMYYQMLVLAFLAAKAFQNVFFGQLRFAELERVYEKSWFAVTETCLAMTIFRDEFNAVFVAQFVLLLAVKMFHWLAQDRVDYMEQTPNISQTFHVRMVAVTSLLAALDCFLVFSTATKLLANGPSMQLLFGFEYLVLFTAIVSTFCKYVLQCVDHNAEQQWDAKAIYMFYVDIVQDFLKLAVYVSFFVVVMNFYGLPLHIIRDLIGTFRTFYKRVVDFFQSRRATRLLSTYPEATNDEIQACGGICVICRDVMEHGNGIVKRLPCGHIFHERCARTWLFQQQICPTCRARVLEMEPRQQRAAAAPPQPNEFRHRADAAQPEGGGGAAGGPAASGAADESAPVGTPASAPLATPRGVSASTGTPAAATTGSPFPGLNLPPLPTAATGTPGPFGLPTPNFTPNPFAHGTPGFAPTPFGHGIGQTPFGSAAPAVGMPPGFVPFVFHADAEVRTQAMSDTELRQLEGQERAKVLQRIEFLRKFRGEVDALLGRFGQYDQRFPSDGLGGGGGGGFRIGQPDPNQFMFGPGRQTQFGSGTPNFNSSERASATDEEGTADSADAGEWNIWHSPDAEDVDQDSQGTRHTWREPASSAPAEQVEDPVPTRTASEPTSETMPEGPEEGSRTRSVPTRQRSSRTEEQERIRQLRLKALAAQQGGDGDADARM